MYVHTSSRGAKTRKIRNKGCFFEHVHKFWREHDGKINKKAGSRQGLFSYPENMCLGCVLKVLLRG